MKKTILILMGVILLFALGAALCHAQGPVAAYGFNENSGVTVSDASGNGNIGNIGTASWVTTGKFGGALKFNGTNSKVVIGNTTSLQLTSKVTLEVWVNPSVITGAYRDLVVKGYENYYISATFQSNSFPGAGSHMADGQWIDCVGTSKLAVNTWTHLAMTYDGSAFRLYVNAVLKTTRSKTGTLSSSTSPLEIGGDGKYGQYFTGLIDEVRVYGRALTQAEIQIDMNTPIAPIIPIPPPTILDAAPDAPLTLRWDYDPAFASQVNGFGLYAGTTATGPWIFYNGILDPVARTFTFVAPDQTTFFTMNACKQTSASAGYCSIYSNIVQVHCVPLSEIFLWQTFTTRTCR